MPESNAEKNKHTEELARAAHKLFSKIPDPSAEEIADAYYEGKSVGGETIDGIRKRLPRIRQMLEDLYEDPAYLVSDVYYKVFRDSPPTTPHDARRCVAGGVKRGAAGIRLNSDPNDIIFREMLEMQSSSSAARLKNGIDRMSDAVVQRRMTAVVGGEILQSVTRKNRPKRPALVEKMRLAATSQSKHISSNQVKLLNPKGGSKKKPTR